MSELIKNEIGSNKISEKIGEVNWVESKLKDTYKEIFEAKDAQNNLKHEIANNMSGKEMKDLIESKLTTDHVKQVLEQALTKFSHAEPGMLGFNRVYAEMGAGLTFNLQLALAKLGCNFEKGIDGMYGSKDNKLNTDTRKRVMEFQNAWNIACAPDQKLVADGWAGKNTITSIISALSDASWDKTKISHVNTINDATDNSKKDVDAPKPITPKQVEVRLNKQDAEKEPSTHNLQVKMINGISTIVPADGYEFLHPEDSTNFATRKMLTPEQQKELDSLKNKYDKIVYPNGNIVDSTTNNVDTTTNNQKVDTANKTVEKKEETKKSNDGKKSEKKEDKKNSKKSVEKTTDKGFTNVETGKLPPFMKTLIQKILWTEAGSIKLADNGNYYLESTMKKEKKMLPITLPGNNVDKSTKRGVQIFSDGDFYVGDFKDGKRTGKGTYVWNNSARRYEGMWKDGMKDGKAIMITDKGDIVDAVWKENTWLTADFHGKKYDINKKINDMNEIKSIDAMFEK